MLTKKFSGTAVRMFLGRFCSYQIWGEAEEKEVKM